MSEGRAQFNDGKAPDALRTIGELSAALNIKQHVLRYWEEQFPMLRPLKRSGGRRYYRPEDIALVETIDRLVHRDGYTLRGARLTLEGKSSTAPAPAPIRPDQTAIGAVAPAMKAKLIAIRDTLATALQIS